MHTLGDCYALAHAGQIRRRRVSGAERLDRPGLPPKSQDSYNLRAISDEGLEQLGQAHLQYYERLRAIVAECKHPTDLALVDVPLLPLDA